jgi:hypothetical protein
MIEDAPQPKFLSKECNAIMHILDENGIKANVTSMLDSEHGRQIDFNIRGTTENISRAIRSIYTRENVESVWLSAGGGIESLIRGGRTRSTLGVSYNDKKW